MEIKTQSLKELYEKDFYLWVQENLRLLKNRELDLVDWENLVEEIEDMGKSLFKSVRSHMSTIMEHLYKWENFRYVPEMGYDWIETIIRYREYVGHSWIKSINNARNELEGIFKRHPSVKAKVQERENIQSAWEWAVYRLINWFKEPQNHGKGTIASILLKNSGVIPKGSSTSKTYHRTLKGLSNRNVYLYWVLKRLHNLCYSFVFKI
jgi:hypothetical protein